MSDLETLRIDRLLWHLRLAKTRSIAQFVAEQGHVRINQRRVERSSQPVHIGDVITMIRAESAIAVRILKLPSQRLPASAACEYYE
jgi:ribosome-associated heat shock protein Hsp15